MPSVLTAIPFVATHQLVIFGVGCVFGHQFGGEAARSRQPVARRLGEMVRGDAREIGGRDAVALARGIDRGGDIAELPAALADRPIFERLRSEERRVGKECVMTCRSRCAPYN